MYNVGKGDFVNGLECAVPRCWLKYKQQCASEKSTNLGRRITSYPECVGVGAFVGGLQCWLVWAACVSVLLGDDD